jgi:DNA-binding transcriptional ArsR family regulator
VAAEETSDKVQPEALAAYFKALSHPHRVRLLHYLAVPHHVEEIASHLGVARQSAQEHLQFLLEAGLVTRVEARGEGRALIAYVMVPQRVFHVYEMVGRLGDIQPELEERKDVHLATQADAKTVHATREEDLPRLVIVRGMRVGRTIAVNGDGPWLIGRDANADVSVDYDPYASLRHAELRRKAGGGFELADLYSSNGTIHDWKRLPRGGVAPLENGALLGIGHTLILFRKP